MGREVHDLHEHGCLQGACDVGITYVPPAQLAIVDPALGPKSDTSTAHFRVFLGQVGMFAHCFQDGGYSRLDTWYTYECARDVLVAHLDRIMTRRLDMIEGRAADAAASDQTAEAPAGNEPP